MHFTNHWLSIQLQPEIKKIGSRYCNKKAVKIRFPRDKAKNKSKNFVSSTIH